MDSLDLDPATVTLIVAEANYAFQLNGDLLHELEPDVKVAVGDRIFDLLVRQDKPGSTEKTAVVVS